MVNQDGTPYSAARVTVDLLNPDGSLKIQIPNWELTDRQGWVTFSAQVQEPGEYTLQVTNITVLSSLDSYDPQKDTKAVKITIK